MSYIGILSFIDHDYYVRGDFNIHVDIPCGDGKKFLSQFDASNLNQSVNKPTHLHGHTLDYIISPHEQQDKIDVKICEFISDHALVKCII